MDSISNVEKQEVKIEAEWSDSAESPEEAPPMPKKLSKSDLKPVYVDILPNADLRTKKLPLFVVKNGPGYV